MSKNKKVSAANRISNAVGGELAESGADDQTSQFVAPKPKRRKKRELTIKITENNGKFDWVILGNFKTPTSRGFCKDEDQIIGAFDYESLAKLVLDYELLKIARATLGDKAVSDNVMDFSKRRVLANTTFIDDEMMERLKKLFGDKWTGKNARKRKPD